MCRCGKTVLFPGGVSVRTCWGCQAKIDLHSTQNMPPTASHPVAAAGFAPPYAGGEHVTSHAQVVARPHDQDVLEPLRNSNHAATSVGMGQEMSTPARNWGFVGVLLIASLCTNVYLLWPWMESGHAGSGVAGHVSPSRGPKHQQKKGEPQSSRTVDTDGDGVPDHEDFCPLPLNSSAAGDNWLSGLATDFDGDGCRDGTAEETDKDNDGVLDINDGCPNTPQQYAFVSNSHTDFDGDGCADGVEDQDNDGDGTLNAADMCPRTDRSHGSDAAGCSVSQRSHTRQATDPRWWEVVGANSRIARAGAAAVNAAAAAAAAADAAGSASRFSAAWWKLVLDEWKDVLSGAWKEVVAGLVVAAASSLVWALMTKAWDKVAGS